MFTNTRPSDPWKSVRENTLKEAMLAVDYSDVTALESNDPVWGVKVIVPEVVSIVPHLSLIHI